MSKYQRPQSKQATGTLSSGLTLLELLVVLGILMVLAATALPPLLTARIRGMVVAARGNIRSLGVGLELYAQDHRRYPGTYPRIPNDPLGLLSDNQLDVLIHPVAYANPEALHDPFGTVESWKPQTTPSNSNDFPKLGQPNSQRSLLYFDYPSLAKRTGITSIKVDGASVVSIGPDRLDSLGAYRPFDETFLLHHFPSSGVRHPYDTVYNPTNGTSSFGDIGGYVGHASRFKRP